MKIFLLLGLVIVSFGCWEEDYNSYFPPGQSFTYPDKSLSEIQLTGDYSVLGTKETGKYKVTEKYKKIKKLPKRK